MALLDTRPATRPASATPEAPRPADRQPSRPPGRGARRLLRCGPGRAWLMVRRHPWLLTLTVSLLTVAFGLQGSDAPAAEYRVWLFRQHGFVLWDDQWYGGHHLLGYSLLFPPAAGILGVGVVGILSCVCSTWAVTKIVRWQFPISSPSGGHDIALLWFSLGVVVDLVIGRLPFALGIAFASVAVLQALRRRPVLTALAAAAASLASPLAGLFLLVGALAWMRNRPRDAAPLLAACSGLISSLVFPEGGVFPFPVHTLVPILVVAAVGLIFAPRTATLARRALLLYAVLAIVLFAIPTPVGGNMSRAATLLAGPAAFVVLRRRVVLLALLVVPLAFWQAQPMTSAFANSGNPASQASYYTGLLHFLNTHDSSLGRVEIPFTKAHWEARFVAPHFPLARGWERQLDLKVNAVLYSDTLNPASYKAWLVSSGVRFVALPDVPLDSSALREAKILRAPQPFLHEVWSDAHWTVWQVTPTPRLAIGPATVTRLGVDGFTVDFKAPGTAEILVRYSTYWETSVPGAQSESSPVTGVGHTTGTWDVAAAEALAGFGRSVCVAPSPSGWTLVHSNAPGKVRVAAEWSLGSMLHTSSDCPDSTTQVYRPH